MNARGRCRQATGSHGEDWLITYSDTITLLLCLFVVLFSLSTRKHHVDRPPPSPVELVQARMQLLENARNDMPPAGTPTDLPTLQDDGVPDAPGLVARDHVARRPPTVPVEGVPPQPVRTIQPKAMAAAPLPASAKPDETGQRVYTTQISSAAFFGPGSATLSASGAGLLRDVAVTLKLPRLAGYMVTVEGHTDDMPIQSTQFPSNWELSTARAAAVVRFLLEAGLPAQRLRASGYADTFPLAPNRDLDGQPIPENQARNRRVVIRLDRVEQTGVPTLPAR